MLKKNKSRIPQVERYLFHVEDFVVQTVGLYFCSFWTWDPSKWGNFCVKFYFLLLTWWMMICWVFHPIFSAWIHEHALVSLLEGLYRPNLTFFLSLQSHSLIRIFDVFDVSLHFILQATNYLNSKGELDSFFTFPASTLIPLNSLHASNYKFVGIAIPSSIFSL